MNAIIVSMVISLFIPFAVALFDIHKNKVHLDRNLSLYFHISVKDIYFLGRNCSYKHEVTLYESLKQKPNFQQKEYINTLEFVLSLFPVSVYLPIISVIIALLALLFKDNGNTFAFSFIFIASCSLFLIYILDLQVNRWLNAKLFIAQNTTSSESTLPKKKTDPWQNRKAQKKVQ